MFSISLLLAMAGGLGVGSTSPTAKEVPPEFSLNRLYDQDVKSALDILVLGGRVSTAVATLMGEEEDPCPACGAHVPKSIPQAGWVGGTTVNVTFSAAIAPDSAENGQCKPPAHCKVKNCKGTVTVSIVNSTGGTLTYQQSPNGWAAPRTLVIGTGNVIYTVDTPCDTLVEYTLTMSGTNAAGKPFSGAKTKYSIGCDKCPASS